jgi:hypothetical protein
LDQKIKDAHEKLNQAIKDLEEAAGFKIVAIDVTEDGETFITVDFEHASDVEHYAIRIGHRKAN